MITVPKIIFLNYLKMAQGAVLVICVHWSCWRLQQLIVITVAEMKQLYAQSLSFCKSPSYSYTK